MRKLAKTLLAVGAVAALSGCATYAYDDGYYAYNDAPRRYYYDDYYGPRYYYEPGVYVAPPSIGLGFSWSSRHYHRR